MFDRRPKLTLLIWLIGIGQFVTVVAGLEVSRHFRTPEGGRASGPMGTLIVGTLDDAIHEPGADERVARAVARLHDVSGWAISVSAPDGRLLAKSDGFDRPSGEKATVPIARDGKVVGVVTLSPPTSGRPPPNDFFVLFACLVLVVAGVGAWITSRLVTKPLARLASVAGEFGDGKLDARSNMRRSDEIGEMGRAFDEMAERIEHLVRVERELLANVSHELRTPLARIRVALDIATDTEEGSRDVTLAFDEIAEDLAELERLVDDVLTATRLSMDAGTRGGMPIRRETVDVRAVVEKAAAKFSAMHEGRRLDLRIDEDLPPLRGDAVLLRRAIDNLIDNARKYSDPGTAIEVVVEAPKGPTARGASRVLVEVRDHGIGIAPEDIQRVFEPFFRTDKSRSRATGGLGLGLVLARRVVEAHGGTLTLESAVGRGVTARVELPTDHASTSPEERPAIAP